MIALQMNIKHTNTNMLLTKMKYKTVNLILNYLLP